MTSDIRDRNKRRRVSVYLLTAGVILAACLNLGATPSPWLLLSLVAADAAGRAFPVKLDPTTGRRSNISSCVTVVVAFALPPGWAIVATWGGALISGVHIRRYRTTPGGMAWGSSWVTCSAAAGILAMQPIPHDTITGAVLAVGVLGLASHVVHGTLAWYGNPDVGLYGRIGRPGMPWLVGLSLGTAAGYSVALDPAALLLFAIPYVAIVAGGTARAVTAAQNQRLRSVLDIAERARRETSTLDLETKITSELTELLGAQARLGSPPLGDEIGAPFPSAADPNRWLVATRRSGPPTWQGKYRPEEVQSLRTVAAVGSAVAESLQLLDHIRHLAAHDPLTGLANRRLLNEELERRIAEARRHHRTLAVLVVDLDHFKHVNDVLGHVAADDVLVTTALRLVTACRTDDIVARWGGEEFVVVAELDEADELHVVAQRVCEELRDRRDSPKGEVVVTASVGAAAYPTSGNTAADVLRAADDAAMAAKRCGRNRVVLADKEHSVSATGIGRTSCASQ
jgi:diguanylate cyclase (GGDEF)-like protein